MANDEYIVVFRDDCGVMTWTSYDSKSQFESDKAAADADPEITNPKTRVVAQGITQDQALALMESDENHVARALRLRTDERDGIPTGGYSVDDLVAVGMMPEVVGRMGIDRLRRTAESLMGRDLQSPGPSTRALAVREGITLNAA